MYKFKSNGYAKDKARNNFKPNEVSEGMRCPNPKRPKRENCDCNVKNVKENVVAERNRHN